MNRKERMRYAKKPLTVPCKFEGCKELFATGNGMSNHMRRVHGVRGAARRAEESPQDYLIRQQAIERLRPIVVRGNNVDSESLWSLLFTAPKRRAA